MKKVIFILPVFILFSILVFGDRILYVSFDPNKEGPDGVDRDYKLHYLDINKKGEILKRGILIEKYCAEFAISRDSKKIAFVGWYKDKDETGPGHNEIFIMDIDGKNKKRLTYSRKKNNCVGPAWDKENENIYFLYNIREGSNEIRRCRRDGMWNERMKEGSLSIKTNSLELSTVHNFLYYRADPSYSPKDKIFRMKCVDIKHQIEIVRDEDNQHDHSLKINKDETEILMSTSENENGYNEPFNIYILNLETFKKKRLFKRKGNESFRYASYSTDFSKIIYLYTPNYKNSSQKLGGFCHNEIWIYDIETDNKIKILSDNTIKMTPNYISNPIKKEGIYGFIK